MKIAEFSRARIELTGWYTLVIFGVSLVLTGLYYGRTLHIINVQYERIEWRLQRDDLPPQFGKLPPGLAMLQDEFELARTQLLTQLLVINSLVILLGAAASYVLSGKTLHPIEVSLTKQQQFVADAAHELKTPITAMKTSLEVTLLDEKLPSKAKNVLQENLLDLTQLQKLSEQLLSLAALEDAPSRYESVLLYPLLHEAVAAVAAMAKTKGIVLTIQADPKLTEQIRVCIEPASFKSALVAILDNAIKYSKTKGEVVVALLAEKKQVSVTVSDSGVGIEAKDLPFIFDRFFRADAARQKMSVGGHGLGLAVAKKTVESFGGKIVVQSTVNQGTTVKIELPVKST